MSRPEPQTLVEALIQVGLTPEEAEVAAEKSAQRIADWVDNYVLEQLCQNQKPEKS